jgi:creatinine amidohydrolase
MVLHKATWPEVAELSREVVVVIPTGSVEQHGPHLPLATDTLIALKVAEAVEASLTEEVLLTPFIWLGASGHHLAFPGTLSASFETYVGSIESIVESLLPHGFHKFFLLNGHGGNSEPNGVALRKLKAEHQAATFAHGNYYAYAIEATAAALTGPFKDIRHACEGETSLMMYLHPELVRAEKLRDDGLTSDPPIRGLVLHFDEMSEQGSIGYATFASAEKGRQIFEGSVENLCREIETLAQGVTLKGFPGL